MINECVDDLLGYMDHCVKEGEMELPKGKLIVGGVPPGRIDLKSAYGCYTMDVIARCAFATDTRLVYILTVHQSINVFINVFLLRDFGYF